MTSLNALSKLLKIRYPIIQAGMAGATTPELVAAVSNAGGLGILGAARMTPDQLLETIRKIKELTTNRYGVNLLLAQPERRITDETHLQFNNSWILISAKILDFRRN
jgi:nitronate monooxygenase